jgi:hypothetical protein
LVEVATTVAGSLPEFAASTGIELEAKFGEAPEVSKGSWKSERGFAILVTAGQDSVT